MIHMHINFETICINCHCFPFILLYTRQKTLLTTSYVCPELTLHVIK